MFLFPPLEWTVGIPACQRKREHDFETNPNRKGFKVTV